MYAFNSRLLFPDQSKACFQTVKLLRVTWPIVYQSVRYKLPYDYSPWHEEAWRQQVALQIQYGDPHETV